MYLHPERLLGASVGAPGHITYINDTEPWPRGTADISDVFGISLNTSAMAKIPTQMIVGDDDNEGDTPGGFWDWVHDTLGDQEDLTPRVDGRLDALKKLQLNWAKNGVNATFETVDNVSHDSDGVREKVLAWLGPLVKQRY